MTEPPQPVPITVVAGSPTGEEAAAIAAVFSTLLLEQAVSFDPLPQGSARSAWDRSRRSLRTPWPVERDWRSR